MTVREALAHSYNIPAVRAAIDAGVPNVIKTASTIGIELRLEPYTSVSSNTAFLSSMSSM